MKKRSKKKKGTSPQIPKQSFDDIEKGIKEDEDGSESRTTSRGRRSLSSLFRRSADSKERALSESPNRTTLPKSDDDDESMIRGNDNQQNSPCVNPRINPRKHLGRMTVREALVETKRRGRSPGKHIVKLQKSVLENKPRDSLSSSLPHILDQFPDPIQVKNKDHDPQSCVFTLPRSKRQSRVDIHALGSKVANSKLEENITHNDNKVLPLDKRKYLINKDISDIEHLDCKNNEKRSPSRSPFASLSRDISPYNHSSSVNHDGQRRDTFTQFMQLRETRPSSRSSTLSNDKLSAFTPVHEPRISPHSSVIPDTHSPPVSDNIRHQSISTSNAPQQFTSFPRDRNADFHKQAKRNLSDSADDIPKLNECNFNKNNKETKNSRGTYVSPRRFSRNSRSSETSDTLLIPVDNASDMDNGDQEVRKSKYHRQFSNSSEKARQKKIKQLQEKKSKTDNETYQSLEHTDDRPDDIIYKDNSKEKLPKHIHHKNVNIQTKHEKALVNNTVKVDTHEIETQTIDNANESMSKPTVCPVKTVKSSSDVPNISQENLFVPIIDNSQKDNTVMNTNNVLDKSEDSCFEKLESVPLSNIMETCHKIDNYKQDFKKDMSASNIENDEKPKEIVTEGKSRGKDKKKSKLLRRKPDKKTDKKSDKKTDKKSEKKNEKKRKKSKSNDELDNQNHMSDENKEVTEDKKVKMESNDAIIHSTENSIDSEEKSNKLSKETSETEGKSIDGHGKRSLKKKKKDKRSSSLKSIRKKHKESDSEGLERACRSSSLTSIPIADGSKIKKRPSFVKEKKFTFIKRSRSVENISKKENTKPLMRSKTVKKPPSCISKDNVKESLNAPAKLEPAKVDKPTPKLSLGAIITMRAKISRMKKAREAREAAAVDKRLKEEAEKSDLDNENDTNDNTEDYRNESDPPNTTDTEQDRERVFFENEINASLGSHSKIQDSVLVDEDILSLDKEVKDIVYEKRSIHFFDDTISEEEMIKQRQRNTRLTGRRESKVRLRQKKFIACCKQAIAFLFSHIGLCSLVIGYCIAGGFIFRALEGEKELEQRLKMANLRINYTDQIFSLAFDTTMNKGSKENFKKEVSEILKKYSVLIFKQTKEAGWDGNDNYENGTTTEVEQWSFPSSLLYAITVMTTIGYGHVAPKTPHGRIVTIAYAVLGIPLTLLCLTNIGDVMAHGFRLLYGKVFCGVCCILFRPPRRKKIDPEKGIPADDKILVHDDEKSEEVIQVPTSVCLLLMSAYIMLGTLAFCRWEGWDVITGTYFCFITLSTIGFGDVVPGMSSKNWNKNEKLVLCGLYLLFGLSLIAMCFNLVQEDVKAKCKRLGKRLGIIDK